MDLDDVDHFLAELTPLEFAFLSDIACRMSEPEIAEKHQVPLSLVMESLQGVVEMLGVETLSEAASCYAIWIIDYERQIYNERAASGGSC